MNTTRTMTTANSPTGPRIGDALFLMMASVLSAPLSIWTFMGFSCGAVLAAPAVLLKSSTNSATARSAELTGPGGPCWIATHFARMLSRYFGKEFTNSRLWTETVAEIAPMIAKASANAQDCKYGLESDAFES